MQTNVEVIIVLLDAKLDVERGNVRREDQLGAGSIGCTPAVIEGAVGLESKVVAGLEGNVGDGRGVEDGVAVRSTGEEGAVGCVGLSHYEPYS